MKEKSKGKIKDSKKELIKIDGNRGEGGGQILRTALALSMFTKKPFEIKNIRKGRKNPGLKMQHLHGINALLELSDSTAEGVNVGSDYIKFFPGTINKKVISIDMQTAGSISLLMQTLLIPCIFSEKNMSLKIKGGTDTKWSIPIDFLKYVILPQLKRFADIKINIEKRGYYPVGGGQVKIIIEPKEKLKEKLDKIKPFELTRQGKIFQIKGIVHATKELRNNDVAERIAKSTEIHLNFNTPINISKEYVDSDCAGCGISLTAYFSEKEDMDYFNPVIIGSDSLGEIKKSSEKIGEEAAKKISEEINSKACVDKFTADNLISFLGLIGGKIKTSKITEHTKTNIHTTQLFLPVKFEIDETNKIITAFKESFIN